MCAVFGAKQPPFQTSNPMDKAQTIKILLIEDDEDDYILTKDLLLSNDLGNFTLDWVSTFEAGQQALHLDGYDVYLIDYLLGGHSGLELLQLATELGITKPIIMLTGKGDRSIDFEAMRLGAADYLVKGDIDYRSLERAIRYAVEKSRNTSILQEQELKYRTLFEKSLDAIFITTPDQVFIDVNRSFLDLLGFDSLTESPLPCIQDIFTDMRDYHQYLSELNRLGMVKDMEAVLKNKKTNSNINAVITSVELKDATGAVTGFQGIIRDVSKQKLTELELRKAEKLAITGKLARTIAHEVRNPLTNISLSVDQLLSEIPDNESLTFYTAIINRNLLRINKLVTELLDSARPGDLKLQTQSINEVLEAALELTKDRIKLNGIKVVKQFATSIKPIALDKEKMQLAILNIIINAVEAMQPNQGVLTIGTNMENQFCVISIKDNGIGILPEQMNLLFDAFYTGKKNGMGLGLTTTHNIIEGHNGSIEVFSTHGKGTEFRLTFSTTEK